MAYSTNDIAKKDVVDPARKKKAQGWVEQVIGRKLSGNFFDALRDGYVLCEVLNKIKPGTCKGYKKSNQQFVARANISIFVKGAKKLGVPQTELFETRDLYDKQRLSAVVQSIFGLSARAKQLGYHGASPLGASYSKGNKRHFTKAQLDKSKAIVPKLNRGDLDNNKKFTHDSYGVVKNTDLSKHKISGAQSVWSTGSKPTNTSSNHDAYGIVKNRNQDKNYKHSNVQSVWSSGSKPTTTSSSHDSYGIIKNMNKDKNHKHSNVASKWSSGSKPTSTSSSYDHYGIVKNPTNSSNIKPSTVNKNKNKNKSKPIKKKKGITAPWSKNKNKSKKKKLAAKWEKNVNKNK